MFFLVVLSIWTVLHVYVFWRIASVPAIHRRVRRKWITCAAIGAWSSYLVAQWIEPFSPDRLVWISQSATADWLGILFLLFICLVITDLVTGFGYLLPRHAPTIRGGALLAGIVLSCIALVQGVRAPRVTNYEVRIANLPQESDGTVVVVASDLHLGTLLGPKWLAERVDQINAQHPDLVVLAGDIVEGHGRNTSEFLPALRRLSAPLGVWAVNGNHEGHSLSNDRAGLLLQDAGFRILRGTWKELRPGLVIAGVDDLTSLRRHGGLDMEAIDRALAGRPGGGATIFVSHTPWSADRAARQGAGLMLSGHTHNGQIWPFNHIVAIRYPLVAGRYEINHMPVIVCRGTGTWGPRMRLWSPGEILRITLRRESARTQSAAAQRHNSAE